MSCHVLAGRAQPCQNIFDGTGRARAELSRYGNIYACVKVDKVTHAQPSGVGVSLPGSSAIKYRSWPPREEKSCFKTYLSIWRFYFRTFEKDKLIPFDSNYRQHDAWVKNSPIRIDFSVLFSPFSYLAGLVAETRPGKHEICLWCVHVSSILTAFLFSELLQQEVNFVIKPEK